MATSTSIAEQFQPSSAVENTLSPDQRMAAFAQAFEMELAEADQAADDAAWPMGKTIWFGVAVSLVLWAIILGAFRLI
jgi:hypothetical protein